jgi:quercetin dioxygenase-like cupin family protein
MAQHALQRKPRFSNTSQVRITRWDHSRPSTEHEIRHALEGEGLRPYSWSNVPGDVYGAHSHSYDKVLYVVQGSIVFGLPDSGQQIELSAGDRLDLGHGVRHDAVVGPRGVVCLEAQR